MINKKGIVLCEMQCFDPKKDDVTAVVHIKLDEKVYGLLNGNVSEGSFLELQTLDPSENHQKWTRTKMDNNDPKQFMLRNNRSSFFLHADYKNYFTNGLMMVNHADIPESKSTAP